MMLRRRMPKPKSPSMSVPASSGPRWIKWRHCRAIVPAPTGRPSRLYQPAIPHMTSRAPIRPAGQFRAAASLGRGLSQGASQKRVTFRKFNVPFRKRLERLSQRRESSLSAVTTAWVGSSKSTIAVRLERAKGFEPSTPTLARLCSTPELRPLGRKNGDRSPWRAPANRRLQRFASSRRVEHPGFAGERAGDRRTERAHRNSAVIDRRRVGVQRGCAARQ